MPMLPAEKLLSLINALGGIVWEAKPETLQFLFVSEEAERILGYPTRTWLEEPDFWVRHTHPDDVERCASLYRRASDRGEDHELEVCLGLGSWTRRSVNERPRTSVAHTQDRRAAPRWVSS